MRAATVVAILATTLFPAATAAQTVRDPNLSVRIVASGLDSPSTMAFIGQNDILVVEKNTGLVQRVRDGVLLGPVLDLAVNFASERGLLGIALHPQFASNRAVYLYWTESTAPGDSDVLSETPVLGNRVDRFTWNGAALTPHSNIIRLRALQQDAGQPERGNHNGGVLAFGPDGKLYIYMGDNGRRGQMQNLPDGPGCLSACTGIPQGNLPDDPFGGPEPDNAHLTGVILRLNDDGTAPADNPFFRAGAIRGGEVGANLQKVFAYGIRNGFGMAFDPVSGKLWEAQNGDDTFTELNLVERGANLGWIQVMGPLARVPEFRAIESDPVRRDPFLGNLYFGLQQVRWSPNNIAPTPEGAFERLFMVFEGGDGFGATLEGRQENPAVTTGAGAVASFSLNSDGTVSYELRATAPISDVTQAHIHLGARGQNGPVVAFLFGFVAEGVDFQAGDVIARGVLDDDDVIARPPFDGTLADLLRRMRQGRAYVNVHTIANPGGEVRGQVVVTDRKPVSHYSDPEFSWKFEVSPAAVGFVVGTALGPQYSGNMFVGAARPFIEGGHLFRLRLTGNRHKVAVDDPALEDRVADNLFKFDTTESETLLFGSGFGVATDIKTGPNGNLYVVSLTNGAIYEIFRRK